MPVQARKTKVVKKEKKSVASQNAADSQVGQDLAGVNSEHYSKVQDAMATIESIPELKDIKDMAPGKLSEGAGMQPYSAKIFKEKMDQKEVYTCGHNLFLTNALRDASPGFQNVPASKPANPSPSQPACQPPTHSLNSTQPICQPTCEASPSTPAR